MSITDELRQYASGYRLNHNMYCMLTGIADHIDAWNRRVEPAYAKVKLPDETKQRIERMVHDEIAKRFAEHRRARGRA